MSLLTSGLSSSEHDTHALILLPVSPFRPLFHLLFRRPPSSFSILLLAQTLPAHLPASQTCLSTTPRHLLPPSPIYTFPKLMITLSSASDLWKISRTIDLDSPTDSTLQRARPNVNDSESDNHISMSNWIEPSSSSRPARQR